MNKIVTVEEFREYTNYYEEDTLNLLDDYLNASTDIVIDYLGYDPTVNEYDDILSGIGDSKLYLRARPVTAYTDIIVNGVAIPHDSIVCKDCFLVNETGDRCFPKGVGNIRVKYTAGFINIPQVIKVAVMRIAALMLAEAGGNIGLTGKAFGDQSRTFINYSSYDKYLKPLDTYRLINFGV